MFRRGLLTVIGFAVVVLAFVIGFAVYPVGAIWLGGIALVALPLAILALGFAAVRAAVRGR
jgi:hypothetical protein